MASIELRVAGMSCNSCAENVARALEAAGACDVQLDWQIGRATIGR
jgi:copper chaperone CopZ